jgi:hypothetical protein
LVADKPALLDADGVPYFPVTPLSRSTGNELRTDWTTAFALTYATTYHIVLEATDADGRSQYKKGTFTTAPEPPADHLGRVRVTLHRVDVSDDADNRWFDWRGEMLFLFEVNGERLTDVDERKVHAPESIGVNRVVEIENAPRLLTLAVQGWERDGNDPGFCSAGRPVFPETAGRTHLGDGCWEVEWNTATTTIDLHAEAADPQLPCHGFDAAGDICVAFGTSGRAPGFTVVASVEFLT